MERVLAALANGGLTIPALMTATGLERHNVKSALYKLRFSREVVTEEGAHFSVHRLTTPGERDSSCARCALQEAWRGIDARFHLAPAPAHRGRSNELSPRRV